MPTSTSDPCWEEIEDLLEVTRFIPGHVDGAPAPSVLRTALYRETVLNDRSGLFNLVARPDERGQAPF
ncbi:MAG: hypothetical protein AAFU65_03135 [Pseudomonadota bacterium]